MQNVSENAAPKKYSEKAIKIMYDNFAATGEYRHIISQDVIRCFINSDNPLDKLACGLAYINEGTQFRKNAIECFEYYFSNPVDLPVNKNNYPYFQEWYLHIELSKLYEKEHIFDKALSEIEKFMAFKNGAENRCHARIADILSKYRDVETALNYLDDIKTKPFYNEIAHLVDDKYKELLERKKRGYVFRPRKK